MPGGSQVFDPQKNIAVATILLRNAYPPSLRSWGMRITVFNDTDPANNATYILRKGLADSDLGNNSNFSTDNETSYPGQAGVVIRFPQPAYVTTVGTSFAAELIPIADIPNNSMLDVTAYVNGIKSDGTEGYAGQVRARFRKNNLGVLTQVGVSTPDVEEDCSGAVTFVLSATGSGIQYAVSGGALSGNFTQSVWLLVTQNTIV